jgi:NADH-quinone oxidoreductase subunit J
METFMFWGLAAMTVTASVLVVGQRNPMYSVLLLIVSFGALSGLYVLLDAPFVAAIQIIIYAGAIMVLFLFVVMLLDVPTEDVPVGYHARLLGGAGPRRFGAVLSAVLVIELAVALVKLTPARVPAGDVVRQPTVYDIGIKLFTEYSFAFEATSVLILVAMVGAIILARKEAN